MATRLISLYLDFLTVLTAYLSSTPLAVYQLVKPPKSNNPRFHQPFKARYLTTLPNRLGAQSHTFDSLLPAAALLASEARA
ncbi:hypothetical protein V8C34DRAFT_281235 [Trichoderma compactum]